MFKRTVSSNPVTTTVSASSKSHHCVKTRPEAVVSKPAASLQTISSTASSTSKSPSMSTSPSSQFSVSSGDSNSQSFAFGRRKGVRRSSGASSSYSSASVISPISPISSIESPIKPVSSLQHPVAPVSYTSSSPSSSRIGTPFEQSIKQEVPRSGGYRKRGQISVFRKMQMEQEMAMNSKQMNKM